MTVEKKELSPKQLISPSVAVATARNDTEAFLRLAPHSRARLHLQLAYLTPSRLCRQIFTLASS